VCNVKLLVYCIVVYHVVVVCGFVLHVRKLGNTISGTRKFSKSEKMGAKFVRTTSTI